MNLNTTTLNQPRTIAEAKALGSKTYYSGRPCKYGHESPRWTSTSTCLICHKQRNSSQKAKDQTKRRLEENPELKEKKLAANRQWRREQREQNTPWYQEHLRISGERQKTPEGREANRLRALRDRRDPSKGRKEYKNQYEKRRNEEDPEHYLRNRMRNMHRRMIAKGGDKIYPSMQYTGCTPTELREYMESLWQPGMTWENKGDWEIDHIRPLASYDLTDPEQYAEAAHYMNLQPLWKEDNRKKSSKWEAASICQ